MPIPNITAFTGQLPVQADPATFPARADALFLWLVQNYAPESNVAINGINTALNTNASVLDALTALQDRTRVVATPDYASLVVADQAKALFFTAAGTIPLPTAGSVGNGFFQRIYAQGGPVSITANGAETINGVPVRTLQKGESGLLYCDGTSWFLFVENAYRVHSTQSWTVGGSILAVAVDSLNPNKMVSPNNYVLATGETMLVRTEFEMSFDLHFLQTINSFLSVAGNLRILDSTIAFPGYVAGLFLSDSYEVSESYTDYDGGISYIRNIDGGYMRSVRWSADFNLVGPGDFSLNMDLWRTAAGGTDSIFIKMPRLSFQRLSDV